MPWKENNNKENKNISYQILEVLTKLKSAVNFDEQSLFITYQYISVKEEWIALGPQRDQTLQIHLKIHIYIMFVCCRVLNIWKPCLRDETSDTVTWTFETDSWCPRIRNIGHGYSWTVPDVFFHICVLSQRIFINVRI